MTDQLKKLRDEQARAFALNNYMTTQEFAAAIRRSDDTVLRMLKRPDRSGFKIEGAIRDGAGYLIPPSEVRRFAEMHKVA